MAELSRGGKLVSATTLLAMLVVMGTAAEATTFHQIWEVKSDYTSSETMNIIVNGESQAPAFFAQRNDIIILQVTNLLTENLSVHLVGVRQNGNPWFGATQYPTKPEETLIKEFVIDNPGIYFYDYYGILMEREAAIYISIHVSDNDESISENPGINYDYTPLAPPPPPASNRFFLNVIVWTLIPLISAVVAYILQRICTCSGPTAEEDNNIQMSARCWCKMNSKF